MLQRPLSLANVRELFRERRSRCLLPQCLVKSYFRVTVLLLLFSILVILTASINSDRIWKRRLERSSTLAQLRTGVERNYGAVIDAGSSGSRIYLYHWSRHSGNPDDLLKIEQMRGPDGRTLVKKVEPGLSAFSDDPIKAYESIQPLLDFAAMHVPKLKQKESLLFLMATAGVRLLPKRTQETLLGGLGTQIRVNYQFQFPPSHTEVLTGKLEGLYEWVAVNYILGRFYHTFSKIRSPTVASLELGGASAQITYEISDTASVPKDLVAYVNLGCDTHSTEHSYILYSSTLNSFGSNVAMQRYYEYLASSVSELKDSATVPDPCLLKEMREQKDVVLNGDRHVRLYLIGTGNYSMCRERLQPILNVTAPCPQTPCSASGIHQPRRSFRTQEFYGVSEYWYTSQEILGLGGRYLPNQFDKAAEGYCGSKWSEVEYRHRYPTTSHHRLRNQCFKSAWMSGLLHEIYHFPRSPSVFRFTTVSEINGTDVQWTLGALLFKTKYLPLREIQRQHGVYKTQMSKAASSYGFEYAVILIIVALSLVAVKTYQRWHKSYRNVESPPPRMLKSRYKFFIPEEDDLI